MDTNTRDPAVTHGTVMQRASSIITLCWCCCFSLGSNFVATHTLFFSFSLCASNKGCFVGMWSYGVMRSWPEHNALQNGVIMTWLWYHNAGQTMTYFLKKKKAPKRQGQAAAAAQPVWPSLSVHVAFFPTLHPFPPLCFIQPIGVAFHSFCLYPHALVFISALS